MIFYISIFSYPGAGLAAGEGTPGREGRDCHRRWIGRGRAGAGSSCTAPWQTWPAPWSGSRSCGGEAGNIIQHNGSLKVNEPIDQMLEMTSDALTKTGKHITSNIAIGITSDTQKI